MQGSSKNLNVNGNGNNKKPDQNSPLVGSPGKFIGSPTKRREMDIMKLMMSDYQVQVGDDSPNEFYVKFNGPKGTPYEGGVWKVRVTIPEGYPYKSPSIGFANAIYHPNIDESSGSVCLDVINQTWSPLFDLVNIFDVFLPQLLSYPNPTDPLNGEAAALLLKDPEKYNNKIKEYVQKYAKLIDVFEKRTPNGKDNEDDEKLSNASVGSAELNDFVMEN